jgi:formylglycine-generating enzyme required for sulfatase activity
LAGVGLLPDPTMIPDKKGIKMVLVEAGPFEMGSNTYSNEQPVHQVILDAFYIDQFEVTNAQYAEFLDDQDQDNRKEGGVTWLEADSDYVRIHQNDDGRWQADAGFAEHPVVEVSWYGANAYCQWRKGRLPTEAEWEKAVSWDPVTEYKRRYPWGENIACNLANYKDGDFCVGDTTAVSDYPEGVSPYGAYNMAGNVWEWVADWYDSEYYAPARDPQGPDEGDYKVLRGGSWGNIGSNLRAALRLSDNPASRHNLIGFRCAVGAP